MTRNPLLSLTPEQWESLCDGCGRCCLVKLEDEDTSELHYTNVTCRYLDTENCRCSDYDNRTTINPRCMKLSPEKLDMLELMPTTCAYRLVHEGKEPIADLDALSVRGRVFSEDLVQDDALPGHIIDWIQT